MAPDTYMDPHVKSPSRGCAQPAGLPLLPAAPAASQKEPLLPQEGTGWGYKAHLLQEDPLYTRTGRQQSLNLEILVETGYLAVSCLASVRAQIIIPGLALQKA